jgi:hypothetical protein
MSLNQIVDPAAAQNPANTYYSYSTTSNYVVGGGVYFTPVLVPVGATSFNIPTNYSTIILQSSETLSSVTWAFPKANSVPGLQISILNKSTTTTINLVVKPGDFLPDYLVPPQIPPSTGPGGDQFYYFQSDGIDTWQ